MARDDFSATDERAAAMLDLIFLGWAISRHALGGVSGGHIHDKLKCIDNAGFLTRMKQLDASSCLESIWDPFRLRAHRINNDTLFSDFSAGLADSDVNSFQFP